MFVSCHFPLLVKLYLSPEYSACTPGPKLLVADSSITDFLDVHPTIEDLRWYPVNQGLLIPNGFLPRLKRIQSRATFSILRDPNLIRQRKMELISHISLDRNTMQLLETIDGSQLQELHIWGIDRLNPLLRRVATLFRTLVIPRFGRPFGHENYSGSLVGLSISLQPMQGIHDLSS